MKNIFRSLVEQKKLLRKTADKISALAKEDQAAILKFLTDFRLNLNYAREFLGYVFDVAKREGVAVAEVLQHHLIAYLQKKNKLPHARQMELLREVLRELRYPYYYGSIVSRNKGLKQPRVLPVQSLTSFEKIYVEKAVKNERITKEALKIFNKLPVKYIDSAHQLVKEYYSIGQGKKTLVLAEQKGKWLERCPGTNKHICCNYLVINNIVNCPYDCTYCYLQTYINNNVLTVYANEEDILSSLEDFFAQDHGCHFRVGTGEFSDSLALDKFFGFSKPLIDFFAGQSNHLLELKTKSAEVSHLLNLKHNGQTVFAWSVNPQKIVDQEELGAVSLAKRLQAAKQCVKAGYPVAFHFDPIIHYAGWEKDYQQVVKAIFAAVPADKIAWISLGALRYQPELKDIIEERHSHSQITLGELDVGEDNKLRYFKPIRLAIFKKMNEFIRSYSKDVYVYLCMESPDVWGKVGIKNKKSNPYAKYFRFFCK